MFLARWEAALRAYLPEAYGVDDLKLFLLQVADDKLIGVLKEDARIPYCNAAIDALKRRNLIDERFFAALIADRPKREEPPTLLKLWLDRRNDVVPSVPSNPWRLIAMVLFAAAGIAIVVWLSAGDPTPMPPDKPSTTHSSGHTSTSGDTTTGSTGETSTTVATTTGSTGDTSTTGVPPERELNCRPVQRRIGNYLHHGINDRESVKLTITVTTTGVSASGTDTEVVNRANENLARISRNNLAAWGVLTGGRTRPCHFSHNWWP